MFWRRLRREVAQMHEEGIVVIISGPAGAGKGSVVNKVMEEAAKQDLSLYLSVSMTSRIRSAQEIEGVSYFFVDVKRFEQAVKNGELLEYNNYNGNYYGTPKRNVVEHLRRGDSVLLEIDVNGGKQVLRRMPDAVRVFIMPPSMAELEYRLRHRGRDSESDIMRRLAKAREEIPVSKEYDYIITNDSIEKSANALIDIIKKERSKAAAKKERQRGINSMQNKKNMDDILTLSDNRYSLVNTIAKRAREIAEDADNKKIQLLEKPVNIVIANLKSGRSTLVKKDSSASLYKEKDFEVSISVSEESFESAE